MTETTHTDPLPEAVELPEPEPSGHDFQPMRLLGQPRPRLRCTKCRQWKDRNPQRCVAATAAAPVDPMEALAAAVAGIDDAQLQDQLGWFVDGYLGNEGSGPAWDAGRVASGHRLLTLGDKIEYLARTCTTVVIGYKTDFTLQAGGTGVKAPEFVMVVEKAYEEHRLKCPACGSRDYNRLFGSFGATFEPTHCDACP